MNTRLLLVGCGKMGSAMLEGWLAQGLVASNVYIVEPVSYTHLTLPTTPYV